MGYTHYYSISPADVTPEQFVEFGQAVIALIEASDEPVAREYDRPDESPMIGEGVVMFNGIGEEGHETFYLSVIPPECPSPGVFALSHREMSVEQRCAVMEWSDYIEQGERRREFCKTARKGYDEIVGAALIAAKAIFGNAFSFSSDGWFTDSLAEEMGYADADFRTWAEPKALYRKVFGEIPERAETEIIAEEAVNIIETRKRLAGSK